MWNIALLDTGISNSFESIYGKKISYEYDFIENDNETSSGIDYSHATQIALAAQNISFGLGYIDLKIAKPDENGTFTPDYIKPAFSKLTELISTYQIGAINVSWGDWAYPADYVDIINGLATRGVFVVAAAGNAGWGGYFDTPRYPAALPGVIAVGAHDGSSAKNPVSWSQNSPDYITVLAAGIDTSWTGSDGTSFAAPQVAATVAAVQAFAFSHLKRRLDLTEMKSVLQLGGMGPKSAPDPADGAATYFVHDHLGSLNYFCEKYLHITYTPYNYLASNPDLVGALGVNAVNAENHFMNFGAPEGRSLSFDGWSYLASHGDLQALYAGRSDAAEQAARHYISFGRDEGRSVTFDAVQYLAANPDLINVYGYNKTRAARHYVTGGKTEGRAVSFDGLSYIASYADLISAFKTAAAAGTEHFVAGGYAEGRKTTFDPLKYLAANADLAVKYGSNKTEATKHYILYGYAEGRSTGSGRSSDLASPSDLNPLFKTEATSTLAASSYGC